MKLIFAILRDQDIDAVTQALTAAGFRVTRVASTGGFLRRGTTTLLIGVEDAQLEGALAVLRGACGPTEGQEKRATIFVTKVESFTQV